MRLNADLDVYNSQMPPTPSIPRSTQFKVRQRSRRACAPCRKRKIKCDGDEPCAACLGYGYECVYAERQPSPKPPVKEPKIPSPTSNTNVATSEAAPLLASWALPQKEIGPYIATETLVADANGALLHQSIKTRFSSSSSAVAFPTNLGLSLGLPNPPRLQSFGWNPGIRPEPKFLPSKTICDLISLDEMKHFADKYFDQVNIYFGVISRELFYARATDFWASSVKHGTDFEACICGVIALGSFFWRDSGSAVEAEIVEHGRVLLDLSTAHPPALLSLKHVAAWVLRAIYLRCTTRPHLSWMASCTAVHLAEALGLHREIKEACMRQEIPRHVSQYEEEVRRRTFWVAMALNQFLSAEYGRTKAHIDLIDCRPLTPQPKPDLTAQTVSIMQSAPTRKVLDGTISELMTSMNSIMALPVDSPFLGLLRADVCFCIYRMSRSTNVALPPSQITALLQVIKVALDGTKFLRTMKQHWWNLVGTPFHCVCVLLSINTSESLAMIPGAMDTLKNSVAMYDTYIPNEALRTACALVQGARAKMTREMESLDQALSLVGDITPPNTLRANGNDEFGLGVGDEAEFYHYFDFENVAGFDDTRLFNYSEPQ